MADKTLRDFTNLKYLGLILFQFVKKNGNVKTVEATEFWFLAANRDKRGLYRYTNAVYKDDKTIDYVEKALMGHSFWADRIEVLGKEAWAVSPADTMTTLGPEELAGPGKGMEAYLDSYFVRPTKFDVIFSVNPSESKQTSAGNNFFYTLAIPFAPFGSLEKSELQSGAGYGTLVLMTDVESEIQKHIARIGRFLRLKAA